LRPVLAVLLVVATAAVTLSAGDFITNDGPQHRFACAVTTRYHDVDTGFDDEYLLNDALTSRGAIDVCTALAPVVGLDAAHAAVVLLAVLWPGLGWMLWAAATGRRRWLWAALFVPLGLQWTIFSGLLPFALGMGFMPFVLAAARTLGTGRLVGAAAVAGLVFVQAQVHVFPAMATGLVLFALWAGTDRSLRGGLGLLFAGVPALVLLGVLLAHGDGGPTPPPVFDVAPPWLRAVALYLPGDAVSAALLIASVLLTVGVAWRFGGTLERTLAVVGVLFVVAGALSPRDAFGWQLFSARFLAVGYPLALASLPWERLPVGLRRVATALALALAVWHLGWCARQVQRADAELAPLLEAAARSPSMRGFHWAYVVVAGPPSRAEDAVLHQAPYFHLSQQVAPLLGGSPGYSHDHDETIHHIINPRKGRRWATPEMPELGASRWRWPEPPDDRHRRLAAHFAGLSRFEKLLVAGLPGDRETLELVGYRTVDLGPIDEDRRLLLGAFEGCSVAFHISDPGTTIIEVGFGPDDAVRDAYPVGADGRVSLLRLPCGPVWLRFVDGACAETGSDMAFLFVEDDLVEGTCVSP
jgi:hypothetical protein